ncbi:hypothetical protein D9M69_659830 [compost metagenome]
MSQQGHIAVTAGKQISAFLHDTFCITAALTTAGKRYHAKGAHIIAATHDADKSSHAIAVETYGSNIGIGLFAAQ